MRLQRAPCLFIPSGQSGRLVFLPWSALIFLKRGGRGWKRVSRHVLVQYRRRVVLQLQMQVLYQSTGEKEGGLLLARPDLARREELVAGEVPPFCVIKHKKCTCSFFYPGINSLVAVLPAGGVFGDRDNRLHVSLRLLLQDEEQEDA